MSHSPQQFLTCHLLVLLSALALSALMLAPTPSSALPTAFRNRLFSGNSDDSSDSASISASPEFARPDETADLQRNSARLHRTLFLLDTSDLLKSARLFGGDHSTTSTKSKALLSGGRAKRQVSAVSAHLNGMHDSLAGKVPLVVIVRKPTIMLTDDGQQFRNSFE